MKNLPMNSFLSSALSNHSATRRGFLLKIYKAGGFTSMAMWASA